MKENQKHLILFISLLISFSFSLNSFAFGPERPKPNNYKESWKPIPDSISFGETSGKDYTKKIKAHIQPEYDKKNMNPISGLISPVGNRKCRLSGRRFGCYQHPILKHGRHHAGLDLKANKPGKWGDPIVAPADNCTVLTIGSSGGYGRQIKISCGSYVFSFNHLSKYKVRKGQSLKKGQIIATMGSTGLSSGPHLHFEVFRNGGKIDPLSLYTPKQLCDRVDSPKRKSSSCGGKKKRKRNHSHLGGRDAS